MVQTSNINIVKYVDFPIASSSIIERLRLNLINERVLSDLELRNAIIAEINNDIDISQWNTVAQYKLITRIFYSLRGLDVLQPYYEDESITEIMINRYNEIFVEKNGVVHKINEEFDNEERLSEFIQSILGRMNKSANELTPIVDSRLFDGSRIHVVLPPISIKGPTLNIRKFPKDVFSLSDLCVKKTINSEVESYLKWAVENKKNIFISGGTGTGKTTLLNAIASCIPSNERIVTIEDTAELRIQGVANIVTLEARSYGIDGKGVVTIRDLIRASLRMRPNRIIVGEVRGPEVVDMMTAMNTGHEGSITTGHSNSPSDLISRIETMALTGSNLSIDVIRKQIAAALDIIVHLERLSNGRRIVKEICEIVHSNQDDIEIAQIYNFEDATHVA
jgi:pilus assembly protein CpaF